MMGNGVHRRLPRVAVAKATLLAHADFLLLLTLFVTFRFCSVLFLRPGGYTRDYTDLIFYQGRASWQAYGLLPYRDYWSEYPPLFAWFSLWIDRLSSRIPLWEDERLWYAALFGSCMVIAETITLLCLYRLAWRLEPTQALRSAWIYAGLFLPVYFLGGWYDALPVATIFLTLLLLIEWPTLVGVLLAGLIAGIGGLLKLVPLAVLAVLPLAVRRWSLRLTAAVVALAVVLGGYAWAYLHGPVMTLASVRSLTERTGWSTLYAWVNGYTRLGKVLGDVFDPAARIAQYESRYPEWLVLAAWLLLGAALLIRVWRRQTAPQPARTIVGFAALTYTLLLLAYPSWNPQYALYLLPFLVVLWPGGRGLCYALALSLLVLIEHPIYHNLIGPDYSPLHRQWIAIDYRQLFLAIILLRTLILLAIAVDFALTTLQWRPRLAWLPVGLAGAAVLVLVALLPQLGRAYAAGRLATSALRPLALYLNQVKADLPVVAEQLQLGRQLRPFLERPDQLTLFGGRPGRIEPLPQIAANGPFLYVHTREDAPERVAMVEQRYTCDPRTELRDWQLWFCNGAIPQPLATFAQGIILAGTTLPNELNNPARLTLFWQAAQPIGQDYTVFVHIVDANGTMVGQWDQVPGAGESPTSGWPVNRLIADDYVVPLKLAQTVAPYRIWVGLYDAPTGTRLAVVDSAQPVSAARLELRTYGEVR
jgi:hypothetical protein